MDRYWYKDARRFANQQGITIRGPQRVFDSRIAHKGALWVIIQAPDKFINYHETVFQQFFDRKLVLDDIDEIKKLINQQNIKTDQFDNFCEKEGENILLDIEKKANEIGVFGVPTWVFEDNELFFGQDRIDFVREKLLSLGLENKTYYKNRLNSVTNEIAEISSKL